MDASDNRKLERWKITALRPHAKQADLFGQPPQHELEELMADLARSGQLQPVEILPDGTILCGHRRIAAARLLGWTEVNAWVRDDLAADPAAAECRLITDNLVRRQLGPLELAGCYRRLKELEKRNPAGQLLDYERGELRDRIGKRLGKSGRSLDRYVRASSAPEEVRAAVAAGKLGLTAAETVAGLTTKEQEQIAAQLRAGGEPKVVVRRHLAAAPRRAKNPNDATKLLVQALTRALADLRGRVEEVRWITARGEKALRGGERLIRLLLKQARALRAAEAEDELPQAEEVDLEVDEADGGPADSSGPDNVAGGTGCSRTGGCGRVPEYSAARGLPGDRPAPGQAAGGGTTRKPGRSRPAGARKGRAGP
jgi:ParB/RepB/Spo0J family partition protein